jgi:predicted outer membrane repeat protein
MARFRFVSPLLAIALGLVVVLSPRTTHAAGVVGNGTPGSCTEAAFSAALTGGGQVTFNCGATPHAINITSTKTIGSNTSINGGGLITLRGGSTSPVLNVVRDITLNLADITIADTGPAPFSIGTTMHNAGTANLVRVRFINNNFLSIRNNGTMTVTASHFEGNSSSGFGGAISNENGTLTVQDASFVGNRSSTSHEGGAIYNGGGTVTITGSRFTGNASNVGGAISNYGAMTINGSMFSGNSATDSGGAIAARSTSELNIINTTISGNTARRGGGIGGAGTTPRNVATLTHVTLANNVTPTTAANQGGANIVLNGLVSITLRNTIVTTSNAALDNCVNATTSNSGRIVNGGGNLQYPGTSCNEADGAAIPTADPKLGALADNGGWTQTHALAADSAALNAASNTYCQLSDQRGVVRPQGPGCDIGAFEYGAVPDFTTIASGCVPASGAAFTLVVNGTNFIPGPNGSRILLNGSPLATTYLSPTQLRATVPAGAITGPARQVAIQTPTVDGGTAIARTLASCAIVYVPLVIK